MRSGNGKAVAGVGSRNGPERRSLGTISSPKCYAEIANHASNLDAETFRLVLQTVERHGANAFEMPRHAAAIHEAGHAIVFESEGVRVRDVRVIPRMFHGREQWGGLTSAGKPWRIDPGTPTRFVLQRIRFDLAGVLAELVMLGDGFSPGSSLDEVARAKLLSRRAAVGRPDLDAPANVFAEQSALVVKKFAKFESALFELADLLLVDEVVRGARLDAILAPVREAAK